MIAQGGPGSDLSHYGNDCIQNEICLKIFVSLQGHPVVSKFKRRKRRKESPVVLSNAWDALASLYKMSLFVSYTERGSVFYLLIKNLELKVNLAEKIQARVYTKLKDSVWADICFFTVMIDDDCVFLTNYS